MKYTSWLSIFKRESAAYFNAPVATIFLLIFSSLLGGLFMTTFFLVNKAEMSFFFEILPWLLCIFLPAVTMRSWAEDRRGNTLELLLTFPMKTGELVVGKFFAALLFYFTALLATFLIPTMIFTLGTPDLGQIAAAYLGALCLGSFFLGIGFFISGFCRDQIVAFVITLVICLGLHILGQDIVAETIDGWAQGMGTWLRLAFSAEIHYAAFSRGVVDLRDVIFFVSGTFLFLMLNAFWMNGRSRRGVTPVFLGGCAVCLGFFIFLNAALTNVSIRSDWTDGKIYTMADASRKILKKLQAPATVKLYISPRDKMPTAFKTFERDLVSKLDELRIASAGKLKYEVIHMDASNITDAKDAEKTAEGRVTKKGVYPFQVQSVESDQMELKLIYAAMTLSYLEKPEDVIPQIYPSDLASFEYKLISKIYKMTFEKYPKIALVAPYEDRMMDPNTAAMLAQLTGGKMPELARNDQYEILEKILEHESYPFERIDISEKQPLTNDYTALFLMEPKSLNARQKYEVNQFLRKGGSVFMAVQNYGFNYAPEGREMRLQTKMDHPLVNDLLSTWGLEVSDNLLLDESSDSVTVGRGGIFDASIPVKLPVQIIVPPQGINEKVPMMVDVGSLFYLWGNAIHKTKVVPSNITYTPLFFSSQLSHEIGFPADGNLTATYLKITPPLERGPFQLGVMAEGIFPDAFENKPVPVWGEGPQPLQTDAVPPGSASELTPPGGTASGKIVKAEAPHGTASEAKSAKLILLGAATMFQNNLIKGGGHYHLIMNVIDTLTFGEDLLGIRAKSSMDRTMPKISVNEKGIWRILVTFFVPLILVILSLFRLFISAHTKQKYIQSLKAK